MMKFMMILGGVIGNIEEDYVKFWCDSKKQDFK